MRKIIAPIHIVDYCSIEYKDDAFQKLQQAYNDDFSYVYKVKCTCNSTRFFIYLDDHPTVIAECSICKKKIIIYDLSFYPAATKLDESYVMHRIFDTANELYVNYEYSDEYLYYKDVDFNPNDITWAKAFVKKDEQLIKILDDETA